MLFHVSMFLLLVLNVVKYGLCENMTGDQLNGRQLLNGGTVIDLHEFHDLHATRECHI